MTLPQHLPDAAAGRSPTGANRGRRWPDAAALLILSAIVLPLYLTTLYPDIVENGDSADATRTIELSRYGIVVPIVAPKTGA